MQRAERGLDQRRFDDDVGRRDTDLSSIVDEQMVQLQVLVHHACFVREGQPFERLAQQSDALDHG